MPKKQKEEEVKCWLCGNDIGHAIRYGNWSFRQYCEPCRKKHNAEKEKILKEYARCKILVMHERAIRMLEKQGIDIYEYQEASEAVLDLALRSDKQKFGSSPEMVAAMELLRNYVQIKMQWPVGNYKADILAEPLKAVIEIDGYLHNGKKVKDNKRDIEIRQILGKEWEIVRIPTKYIEENVQQLVPAIEQIRKYKQELRGANGGIIPEIYSQREADHYKQLLKGKTKAARIPTGMSCDEDI